MYFEVKFICQKAIILKKVIVLNIAPNINKPINFYLQICKSKMQNPINLHFVALKGPYGETKVNPAIYQHEFSSESPETPFRELPLSDYMECNRQLSAKNINMRLILFQVPK